jgi:hypothetical protein
MMKKEMLLIRSVSTESDQGADTDDVTPAAALQKGVPGRVYLQGAMRLVLSLHGHRPTIV